MPKYRKKPIIIEAEVYQPGMEDGFEKVHHNDCFCCQDSCHGCIHYKPYIKTLEGNMYISKGDYIIVGVRGERYPCKPDIFEETYELVEEDNPCRLCGTQRCYPEYCAELHPELKHKKVEFK